MNTEFIEFLNKKKEKLIKDKDEKEQKKNFIDPFANNDGKLKELLSQLKGKEFGVVDKNLIKAKKVKEEEDDEVEVKLVEDKLLQNPFANLNKNNDKKLKINKKKVDKNNKTFDNEKVRTDTLHKPSSNTRKTVRNPYCIGTGVPSGFPGSPTPSPVCSVVGFLFPCRIASSLAFSLSSISSKW